MTLMKLFFTTNIEYETGDIAVRFLKFLQEICHQWSAYHWEKKYHLQVTLKKKNSNLAMTPLKQTAEELGIGVVNLSGE